MAAIHWIVLVNFINFNWLCADKVGILMTILLPELGYTPVNLRALIEYMGCTQAQVAEKIGVSPRVLRKWLTETDKVSHADMPLHQWRKLLAIAQDCA